MEEALIKRVMPHDEEAESSVIGAMLIDNEAIMVASELITGEDFYQKQMGVGFFNARSSQIALAPALEMTRSHRAKRSGSSFCTYSNCR